MAFTTDDLTALKDELLKDGGVLTKIEELADATEEQRSKKIIPLIGAIISLIVTAIKAAMD
ncbi:hypothetical protein [Desulfonema ishimotonii]|uniref:hypothetical protein n=1 Tax=Desulfonema ishimotonii TaxID=45657 RepID=UPI000F582D82|nr:hypothetical protein [Desulfonema ishimotonii]